MAENRRDMGVPRDAVWAVLTDGWVYADWVVGTTRIRDVDAGWPAVGTRLHYRIGAGRLRHDGHTEVLAVEEGRRLELEAHAWPVGSAVVKLRLEDGPTGCRVWMAEAPARGLGAWLHNPVGDLLLKGRNVESLRRLERLARRRAG